MFSKFCNQKQAVLLLLLFCLVSCSRPAVDYRPDSHLTKEEQIDFLYSISRYHNKLAPKANHNTKFEDRFDEYYQKLSSKHELVAYITSHDDGYVYFMTYRIAPSIHVKKVATAGRLQYNQIGEITHYEELFRTWKMMQDELDNKAFMLFNLVIQNKDISPYLPQNSGKEEYIEFPDAETSFDIDKRRWVSTRENPLEEFYQIEAKTDDSRDKQVK